jgi:small subunit ribosomal protein S17
VSKRATSRTLVGTVVSDKMDKTVVVRVERLYLEPTYEKYVRRYTKFMAHDESNACEVGDKVRIVAHRPLSKHKRWKVQAKLATGAPPRVEIGE